MDEVRLYVLIFMFNMPLLILRSLCVFGNAHCQLIVAVCICCLVELIFLITLHDGQKWFSEIMVLKMNAKPLESKIIIFVWGHTHCAQAMKDLTQLILFYYNTEKCTNCVARFTMLT